MVEIRELQCAPKGVEREESDPGESRFDSSRSRELRGDIYGTAIRDFRPRLDEQRKGAHPFGQRTWPLVEESVRRDVQLQFIRTQRAFWRIDEIRDHEQRFEKRHRRLAAIGLRDLEHQEADLQRIERLAILEERDAAMVGSLIVESLFGRGHRPSCQLGSAEPLENPELAPQIGRVEHTGW